MMMRDFFPEAETSPRVSSLHFFNRLYDVSHQNVKAPSVDSALVWACETIAIANKQSE